MLCRINESTVQVIFFNFNQLLYSYNPPSSSYGSSAYNVGGNGYYSGGSNQILYPGYVDDVQLLIRKAPPSIRIKESDVLDVA